MDYHIFILSIIIYFKSLSKVTREMIITFQSLAMIL